MGMFDWLRRPAATPPRDVAPAQPMDLPGTVIGLAALSHADRRAVLLRELLPPVLRRMEDAQGIPDSPATRVMLLAIAGQESGCSARRQAGEGPARGLWQFERGGGVAGVLRHPSTAQRAEEWCRWRGVDPVAGAVHPRLESDDALACAFARLLLWTDPSPMPTDGDAGWRLYERVWRPGRPHPERWAENWRMAVEAVGAVR